MGKFRIVNVALGIDFIPSMDYSCDVVRNICDVQIDESPYSRKRDPDLLSQKDRFAYHLYPLLKVDFENVFKQLKFQEIDFYPDSDKPEMIKMKVKRANHYYRNNVNYKDALFLELINAKFKKD